MEYEPNNQPNRRRRALEFVKERFWGGFDNVVSAFVFLTVVGAVGGAVVWIWAQYSTLVLTVLLTLALAGIAFLVYRNRLLHRIAEEKHRTEEQNERDSKAAAEKHKELQESFSLKEADVAELMTQIQALR